MKKKTPIMKLLSSLQYFGLILGCLYVVHSQTIQDSCITSILPNVYAQIPFDTSSLTCFNVWPSENFLLRYSQAGPSLWSFVLSAPNTNSYVAMGFSPNGGMVGSSAIVGWLVGGSSATMKRYYLGGKTPNQVVVDQGNLRVFQNSSAIVSFSSRMYIAFQLVIDQPSQQLVYAVGGNSNQAPSPSSYQLTVHRNQITVSFNYDSGQGSQVSAPYSNLKRVHGILNAVGWGGLILIGAMIARYTRHLGSKWFYAHACIQTLGFILGLSGVVAGLILNDRIDVNVAKHKAIGIVIITLGCLQILAILIRPSTDSKRRKFWNWYHHNVGRLLIVLAVFNVFYGINLANAGSDWNVPYGVFIGIIVTVALSLELRSLTED
ncbi:cytochrome b561 and DOMON domain-containing protein At3g07570-like [Cynara cardunculus var. scolymus]|uniref:Carbohydrate-binding domain family 9-like protein n=1 Tax=Cynara cardunculus var. scolymus TaxID=59895 RepID=A0A103YLY2_CYNCS|nr:cytochrome b561 and DOMON domain-containing protein At3g07570-like [Cynara cardunculus var. scolymus]KVI11541.1 Carbohydrate-binding domain family 9-like protein [Cynara cardunculus var. scolymus]